MSPIPRPFKVFLVIVVVVLLLAKCETATKSESNERPAIAFTAYAGSASCASCHKKIFEDHLHTAHQLSTAPATEETVMGSFTAGSNRYSFTPNTAVMMEHKDNGAYQVAYDGGKPVYTKRMDMIVGSGRKGQSYINVSGDTFTQLPITYFTAASQWSNSPGYPPNKIVFNRPVTSRCLECHATFVGQTNAVKAKMETFDPAKIIYGVTCEKCHGPAAKHVAFQTQNPQAGEAKFIVNPAKLSRRQNLDLCSLCHGGRLQKKSSSFSFQAGDSLSDYFQSDKNFMDATNIDVHGNQAGLLSASKCFQLSQLTCNNCHSPHQSEKENTVLFSQRCQSCHSEGHQKVCKLTASIGPAIIQNCLDCHMPKQASHSIAVYLQGAQQPTPVYMRTHWIKIYPGETEKVKALLKNTKTKNATAKQ